MNNMVLHSEFVKKYFSHPRHLLYICKDHLDKACSELEEDGEWKYHMSKVYCILQDYFKTEGISPELYINDYNKYK